jgi:hypothetical protein
VILKMHAVRVYGSNNSYGAVPNQNPISEPIIIGDFPVEPEQCEVLLGEVPKLMVEAHRRKTALANTILDMTFGRSVRISDEYTFDDAIRDQLKNEIAVPPLKDYPWYVTVSISRSIEISDDALVGNKFPLAKIPAETDFREFYEYAKPFIDHIAAIISTVTGIEFFEHVLFDEVLFTGETGIVTRIPEGQDFRMSARASVGHPIDSFDLARLKLLLFSKPLQHFAKNRWLERAIHWYSIGINEVDHWKAFQFLFLALEILTHKLHKAWLTSVNDSLRFRKSNGELLDAIPVSDLLGNQERHSLVSKFCIVSLALSPDTAKADVSLFKEIKTARDRFSHGLVRNERELPLDKARDLCVRYFGAIFLQDSLETNKL